MVDKEKKEEDFSICHILAKIIVLFLPRPLGYDCNDFGLLFLYSSRIVQARSQVACSGGAKHVISGLNHAVV